MHPVVVSAVRLRTPSPAPCSKIDRDSLQWGSAAAGENDAMDEPLTPEHFLPHVDKVFQLKGGRHALKLTQVDVHKIGDKERESRLRQPFNLLFTGPPGDVLREGMYVFEVDGGAQFELYVMPVHTPDRGRQDYQAMFN
jgi:hypothetical protein